MTFLSPGWIAVAALASLAVAAIHLIAWRQPRAVKLPTARFVPDEPARFAARTVRPSDLALLALRVAILMAGGLALARPAVSPDPGGEATVVAMESGLDTAALGDSIRAHAGPGPVAFVVFDTVPAIITDEAAALREAGRETAITSLSVGLLAAIREARRLAREHESVRIVLAASFARSGFDAATQSIRDTWRDSIRIVRIQGPSRTLPGVSLETRTTGDDPVAAGLLLARSNGMLRGASRVIRDSVTPLDAEWAEAGRTLVVWPRSNMTTTDKVDGVHAGGFTAIGHYLPRAVTDTGRVIARWADGTPAAFEVTRGSGCVRSIGFDLPDAGDFALTPSFQRLASVLVSPCGSVVASGVLPDSVIQALVPAPAGEPPGAPPDETRVPNRLAPALLALAVLLSLVELLLRRRNPALPVEQRA